MPQDPGLYRLGLRPGTGDTISGRAKRRFIPRLACGMEGEYPAKNGVDGMRGTGDLGEICLTSQRVSRMNCQ
ncbi:hypothetical protein AERO9A_230167 [Aeromonas salmonicida]|nr:hypothetical protein AERO9A_230167 [Aeromonas salmonicida]